MPKAAGFPPKGGGARLLAGACGLGSTVPHQLDLTRSGGMPARPSHAGHAAQGGRPMSPDVGARRLFQRISPRLGS